MDGRSITALAPSAFATAGADGAVKLASIGVFAAIVKLVGGALSSWAEADVAGAVGAEVRLAVLDEVLSLQQWHSPEDRGASTTEGGGEVSHGDRLAALTTHVGDIERGVSSGVLAEVRATVQLVPLGVLLVVLAPRLAGSAVLALAGFGLLAFGLRRAFKQANQRAAASAGALVEAADAAVRHAELWATYGAKRRIRAHVGGVGRAIAREAARLRVRASLLSSTSEVLGALALVLALLLAAHGAFGVDQSTVVPFAIAFFMAYRPLRELVEARLARARGEAALVAALGEPSDLPAVPSRPELRASLSSTAKSHQANGRSSWTLEPLVLRGVRTRHGTHAPLSLTVPAGAIVAVVGPTGVGKTSLLRAMLGLDALQVGSIRYGARRLENASVGPSERPFAWVPQDAPVVGDTLAINVGLGRADDDGPIPDPAPVLAELGNDTLVASLGDEVLATVRRVSGGERQWIAVARAFATGLPVLLLDEPTSALDDVAQRRLLDALARLRGKRTVILVTHRPEPLAIADMVVRIDAEPRNGRSTEDVQDRAGGDRDRVRAEEVAVEHVRAGTFGEA